MKFRFHPSARSELIHAVEYYESCEPGLGRAFLDEVQHAVARAASNPSAWSPFSPRARRCPTRKFPFFVIYRAHHDHLQVLAIANMRGRPGYWAARLNENKGPYDAHPPETTGNM
jgi:plasmid stabilization system protein ParE